MDFWIPRAELAGALAINYETLKSLCSRQCWETRQGIGSKGRETKVRIASMPQELQDRYWAAVYEGRAPLPQEDPESRQGFLADLNRIAPKDRPLAWAKLQLILALDDFAQKPEYWLNGSAKLKALRDALEQYNRERLFPDLYMTLGKVSERTVYGWRQQLKEHGLEGLVDQRRQRRSAYTPATPGLMDFVRHCLLSNPTLSAAAIRRLMKGDKHDWPMPSASTMRRVVAIYRHQHQEQLLSIHQPSQAKRRFQFSLGRADAGLIRPNQRWETDSTRADILGRRNHKVIELVAKDGKRFTMIAAIDVYSRRPVVLLEEKGGGYAINLLLRKAVRRLGIPETIVMDLGKDYRSNAVQSFCGVLGVEVPDIPGYSPELKPHIERFFATIQGDCLAHLPGYISNKVGNRREIVLPKMSRQEIQQHLDSWIEAYESREHSETGQTPLERGNPAGWRRVTVPDEQLQLLLNPPEIRGVRQGRIRHRGGYYYARELGELDGSAKVLVRENPEDAGVLSVYLEEGHFLCLARDVGQLGLTPQQISEERRAFNHVRKLRRQEAKAAAESLDLVALHRAAVAREVAEAAPVKLCPVDERDIPGVKEEAEALAAEAAGLPEYPSFPDHQGGLSEFHTRPAYFDSLKSYWEWTRARQALDLAVTNRDLAKADEFELGSDYQGMSPDYWRWHIQSLVDQATTGPLRTATS
ncbi:MAG: DDE-type integrase/transposase/recombinase [Pseudomonadota bacterium]